jgi:hypothetical protein
MCRPPETQRQAQHAGYRNRRDALAFEAHRRFRKPAAIFRDEALGIQGDRQMAFKPKSAAETKAKDLGLALARIAESDGTPTSIGVDQLRRVSPRLTPLAIGQMVRKERAIVEETLAERGLALIDYADQGPGRGMEFAIDAAG